MTDSSTEPEHDQDSEPPLTTPPVQAGADADVDDQDAEPTQNVPDAQGPSGHS